MLQTLKNAWNTKEIRAKILFTFFILLIYRIGTVIPVPFVDTNNFASVFSGTILDYMNILSGGSLEVATLFALGVTPYINASIIIQLLAVAFPKLGELSKDESGKKIMNMITRITTVVLALVTAIGYYFLLKNNNFLTVPASAEGKAWIYAVVIVACYCAGACIIMWLGERINERGLGNGISIILFANIVAALPSKLIELVQLIINAFNYGDHVAARGIGAIAIVLFLIAFVIAVTVFVIFITGSERRIPVQYAKMQKGRKMYGGQSSFLPIKLNMVGVMPVIFASSIVSVVPTILALCSVTGKGETFWDKLYRFLGSDGWFYPVILLILIIAFTYFYTEISFNPREIANNLKRQGGTVAGIRQGRPTADYIQKILGKITLVGAFFLAIIAIIPIVGGPLVLKNLIYLVLKPVETAENASYYQTLLANAMANAKSYSNYFTFGGTTLLIVVGVVLETFRDLEAQLTMRNHKNLF
ncbi:MAG: preprotein translocase subunit SecY [Clostridia bacterium]|nr:preprotein translocase subunit SecY [Clostridia bacterium]